ncbi:class I SAM-dependent DNA methyltransferase [Phycicoccus jejuensis]|uniref:class I SAM-dependent DNA methyltransferase n=1 Tax=Phycicoccus jejuensis TaxID=367299 RepID=UPI00384ECEAF
MSQNLLPKVDRGDFQEVFIEDLNWLAPDVKQTVSVTNDEGSKISARNVASYKGLRVWVCEERPGSALEAELDRLIAKTSTDRLVIFDGDQEQVWRWPVRRAKDGSVTSRLTSHRHKKGDADPKFAARLEIIRMPFDVVLDANAVLSKVRHAFDTEAQNESKRASKLMANMYGAVEKAYPASTDPKRRDHEISVTLARILFLMFGDDTEMWQTDAFRNVIQHETRPDGSDLARVLNDLFTFLDTPRPKEVPTGFEGFKYVNGGIFDEKINLPALGKDFRTAILDACAVDWSGISPAIFGSMFQSVRDAETRRALGEHYTSEENILKTLNPLFLDELRDELTAALARDTTQKKVNALNKLWDRLGDVRFMDPACGCGNFIIVAYRELRAIELQVMEALYDLRDKHQLSLDAKSDLKVTLDHFYGIEIDEWPARIAETAMFMMDRQCDLNLQERFGQAPERLPLQREATITISPSLAVDWPSLVDGGGELFIAGNPPFRGGLKLSPDQAAERSALYNSMPEANGLRVGRVDYVCAWFAKGAEASRRTGARVAFVATNSITQGEQARVMGPLMTRLGAYIHFAYRTFAWDSDAQGKAAVHVVIIGFRSVPARSVTLFAENGGGPRQEVVANWWLAPAHHVEIPPRRHPFLSGLPRMTVGSQPTDGAGLLITQEEVQSFRDDPVAAPFVKRYMGAEELLHDKWKWCLWLTSASNGALTSRRISERLAIVSAARAKSPTKAFRETPPHLFTHRKHPRGAYIALPQNSTDSRTWIPAEVFDEGTVASNKATIVYPAETWLLGLLQSQMYQTWIRTVGGRLKSDPTITADLAYNSYPWPDLDEPARGRLTVATEHLIAVRSPLRASRSLAELYEPRSMPVELEMAHRKLDAVVDELYGLRQPDSAQREAALFERYRYHAERDRREA